MNSTECQCEELRRVLRSMLYWIESRGVPSVVGTPQHRYVVDLLQIGSCRCYPKRSCWFVGCSERETAALQTPEECPYFEPRKSSEQVKK